MGARRHFDSPFHGDDVGIHALRDQEIREKPAIGGRDGFSGKAGHIVIGHTVRRCQRQPAPAKPEIDHLLKAAKHIRFKALRLKQ